MLGNERELPFYLTGIGVSDPEYNVDREGGLVSHQFLFTLDGVGTLEVDGKTYLQTAGCCFYLSPGVAHRYAPVDGHWKTAWLVFRGSELSQIMPRLGLPPYLSKDLHDISSLMRLFDKIYAAAQDSLHGSERCSALIYELILKLRRRFLENEPPSGGGGIAETAVRYIDERYAQDITLEQLAANSGVSVQHFCRCFKAKMGMRPLEYVAQRRVAQSKQLLLNTDMSITDIAAAVGYSGVTYFGMVFRKYEGVSPSEFRKNKGLNNM